MDPILAKLDSLCASLRRLALSRGLAITIGVLLIGVMLVGGLDFAFRWSHPAARWLAWGSVVGAGIVTACTALLWPLLTSVSRLQIALRIERADPRWDGELAAYVGIVEGSSVPVRPDAIQQMQQDLLRRLPPHSPLLDETSLLDGRPVRIVWGAAASLIGLGLVCLALRPLETWVAVARLSCPWNVIEWPRETRLEVYDAQFRRLSPVEPLHVVADQPLTVFFHDAESGPPSELTLMLHQGRETHFETLTPVRRADPQGKHIDVFQATLFPDRRQLFFRATAKDDETMRWYSVIGTSPPRLVSASAELSPPSFTGRETETFDPLPPRLTGLSGTTVTIRGKLDQPVEQALLHLAHQTPRRLPLDASKREFTVQLTPRSPGRLDFWFRLIGSENLQDPDPPHYEFIAVEDRLPEVRFDEPTADLQVTPHAEVPVRVTGMDDYGVGTLFITVATKDENVTREIGRIEAPQPDQSQLSLTAAVSVSEWTLGPGDRLKIIAFAADRNPGEKRTQRSVPLEIAIVSEDEKRRELAARLATIADGLIDAARQQNHVFESVRQLQIQQAETSRLRGQDIDLLRAVEEQQREVRRATSVDERSVAAETAAILHEYRINKLGEQQTVLRLSSLLEELKLLHDGRLTAVEELLANTLRRIPVVASSTLAQQGVLPLPELAQIEFDLRASVQTLADLAASVDEWRRRNNLTEDLDRVVADFESLHRDTISVGQRTIAASIASLTPQDRAELAKLTERQQQIAGDVERLTNNFRAAGANQPYLIDAADRLEQKRLSAVLREGAIQLQRNNIGQAVTSQTEAAATLAEVSQIVKGTAIRSVESLLKQVSEAEAEVEMLRGRESSLERSWKEIESLSAANDRRDMLEMLVKRHEELSLEISELARQLRLSGLDVPPALLDQAAAAIRQTREMLPKGRGPEINQGYRDSAELLTRAGNELKRLRKNLEWEAAAEQLWTVRNLANSLADRQQTLEKEVRRLEGLRQTNGRLSRAELRTLQQTASAQRSLSIDVQALAGKVGEQSLLRETIAGAADEMDLIAQHLDERNTAPVVADRQLAVQQRLRELAAAIQTALDGSAKSSTGPMEATAPEQDLSPQSLGTVAELRLLLTEQQRLKDETVRLMQLPSDDPNRQSQASRLAERQRRLTDWFSKLLPNAVTPER